MNIRGISHIGIAVRQWDAQIAFYRDILGLPLLSVEEVPDQQVKVAMFQLGEATIELLAPLSANSPVARFLDKHGEGIHHLAYAVDDLDQALEQLDTAGVRLIDKQPRPGAHGKRIAFLHPQGSFGVLTELCE